MATPNKTTASKAIEPKKINAISAEGAKAYAAAPIEMQNVLLPKILLMQPMSKPVINGQATFLELRETLNNELLAAPGQPIELIPFASETLWIIHEMVNDKRKFLRIEKAVDGQDLPFEENINGKKIVRTKSLDFYCLIPKHIEEGTDLPHVLAFRVTSLRVGKQLYTLAFVKNRRVGRDPWARVLKVSTVKSENDKGTFGIFKVEDSRAATEAECTSAKYWFNEVNAGKTVVDTSDLDDVSEQAAVIETDKF